jgi:hypothetical protein
MRFTLVAARRKGSAVSTETQYQDCRCVLRADEVID